MRVGMGEEPNARVWKPNMTIWLHHTGFTFKNMSLSCVLFLKCTTFRLEIREKIMFCTETKNILSHQSVFFITFAHTIASLHLKRI